MERNVEFEQKGSDFNQIDRKNAQQNTFRKTILNIYEIDKNPKLFNYLSLATLQRIFSTISYHCNSRAKQLCRGEIIKRKDRARRGSDTAQINGRETSRINLGEVK